MTGAQRIMERERAPHPEYVNHGTAARLCVTFPNAPKATSLKQSEKNLLNPRLARCGQSLKDASAERKELPQNESTENGKNLKSDQKLPPRATGVDVEPSAEREFAQVPTPSFIFCLLFFSFRKAGGRAATAATDPRGVGLPLCTEQTGRRIAGGGAVPSPCNDHVRSASRRGHPLSRMTSERERI